MNQKEWARINKRYFRVDLNGFDAPPLKIYNLFLKFIDSDGKVIDLGCGNGMLLRFLQDFSGYKLIPYGIDVNETALKQAQQVIFKERADNFKKCDVTNYEFKEGPFDFIIADISLCRSKNKNDTIRKFVKRCYDYTLKKLILYCQRDILIKERINMLSHMPKLNGRIHIRNFGFGPTFSVIEKI